MSFRLLIVALFILIGLFVFQNDLKNFQLPATKPLSEPLKPNQKFNEFLTAPQSAAENISAPPLKIVKEIFEVHKLNLTSLGIIIWTNTERAMAVLPTLKENENLNKAALAKARDMFKNQYFEHISPVDGVGPAELAKQAGYDYLEVGENLILGNFENDKAVVEGWMNSSGHRANILNSKYKEIGVAALKGIYQGKEVWIAVQEFGRPTSDCPAIEQNLKSAINTNKKEIEQLAAILETKKAEIESMERGDPSLNQKIEEYNELVNRYNTLINQTKTIIETYNNQVFLLNQCLQ
ncbi:MAG: CAP domain-containing protein [Patescibacteria group bacterium]